jgi:hypothetical protein
MAKRKGNKVIGRTIARSNILHDYIHAHVDPFSPGAQHVKLHDGNNSRTIAYQSRSLFNIPADAGGESALSIMPVFNQFIRHVDTANDAHLVNGQISGGAAIVSINTDDYSLVSTALDRYRVVSWGIRIYTIGAALNLAGQIRVNFGDEFTTVTNAQVNVFEEESYLIPVQPGMDVTIVPPNVGEANEIFLPVTTNGSTIQADPALTYSHRVVNLYLSGITSSEIALEVVMNVEATPAFTSITRRMTTPAAPHDIGMKQIIYNAKQRAPKVSGTKSWLSKAFGAVKSAVSAGAHLLGGPSNAISLAGRMAGYLAGRMLGTGVGRLTNGSQVIEVD